MLREPDSQHRAEAIEPICDNVRRRGKVQNFTAWLVEVGGRRVGHPPRTRRSIAVARNGLVLAMAASVLVIVVLFCGDADAARGGPRDEHWRTVDQVGGVGRMESACIGGRPRVRYKATGGTTERVAVKIGPG